MGPTDGVVVSLGAAAMDMVFSVSKLPEPDEMVFAEGEVCFSQEGQLRILQQESVGLAIGLGSLAGLVMTTMAVDCGGLLKLTVWM